MIEANTARVTFVQRGLWRATVGPLDVHGRSRIEAYGMTPWGALIELGLLCQYYDHTFDETITYETGVLPGGSELA